MEILNTALHLQAFIIVFVLSLIWGPIAIPILRKLKLGQTVRDDGPQTHLKKMGTPTIGGIIFLIPILLFGIYASFYDKKILPLLFVTVGFGIVGFLDDFIKVVKKRKDGLYPKQKMLGLLVISVSFASYVYYSKIGTQIIIPFTNGQLFDLSWMFIPFAIIVLLAVTNAVNLTDGVDGLATGITLIVVLFFVVVSGIRHEMNYVLVYTAAVAGGCLGFLAFNLHPAKVFMGDTGSLALGGAVGAIAIVLKMPLILIIVGGVYVIETLSVIIQVIYYKFTGKRIFKMAPLHHHFEISGWKENKIVIVFVLITILFCILGFYAK